MVYKAVQTLDLLNRTLAADNGNTFRMWLGRVLPHIGDAYRSDEDPYRTHLGASIIGGQCERAVAYAWRWALKRPPRGRKGERTVDAHGRMTRLWNRGHLEEGRFIALLLTGGIAVYQQGADGKQYKVSDLGGHFGGSCDGVVMGIPDLPPGVPALGEFKTHSEKSFEELVEKGLRLAKPAHYAQMMVYMQRMGLVCGFYLAVNKNTDELYAEIVQYDREVDDEMLARAKRIVFGDKMPPRLRMASPGFYVCKYMCDFTDVCFSTVKPDRSCRTCQHWFPMPDGTSQCALGSAYGNIVTLDKAAQIAGCQQYTLAPMLK